TAPWPAKDWIRYGAAIITQSFAGQGAVDIGIGKFRPQGNDLVKVGPGQLVKPLPQVNQAAIEPRWVERRPQRDAGVVTGESMLFLAQLSVTVGQHRPGGKVLRIPSRCLLQQGNSITRLSFPKIFVRGQLDVAG